ncbi:MAG: hypothetical protein ACI9KE_002520, partial [Polyangiales bacterium]
FGNGSRQSRFAVVNMTNGSNVDVGLIANELFFTHLSYLRMQERSALWERKPLSQEHGF